MTGPTGDLGRRCACRPGCLTWLCTTDDLVVTADGVALAGHLDTAAPVEELTFDFADLS